LFFLSAEPTRSGGTARFGGDQVPAPVRTQSEVARLVFGAALPTAQAYAELLSGPGVERGLLGPAEAERIWDRHLLNCAVVAELVPSARELVDIGSGAGLPGIVLAMLLPHVNVVLVESMARRTTFLAECVRILGLNNVDVRRGRAEDMTGRLAADVVTARAVARLDRLALLAAGVAKPGGLVLALKGAAVAEELAEAAPVLQRLGASGVKVVSAGAGVVTQPTTVVRFRTSHDVHLAATSTRALRREEGTGRRQTR
jgi:16S rRNA (guanine527-N7)-methyltransferase